MQQRNLFDRVRIDEVVFMDFERAAATRFGPTRSLGPEEALRRMREAGAACPATDLAWVRNHYQLIVWKLAAEHHFRCDTEPFCFIAVQP